MSEAYEVLSDDCKRALYDKYGEEVLKEGFLEGGQLHGGQRFRNNPLEIFEGFVLMSNSQDSIYDHQGKEEHGSMFGN